MKHTILQIAVAVLTLVLLAEAAVIVQVVRGDENPVTRMFTRTEQTQAPTEETEAPTAAPTAEATTQPPTEPEPEPVPEHFTLTFAGDCTLGSAPNKYNAKYSFLWFVQDNYQYPFENVLEYFEKDDLTVVNLESTFFDEKGPSSGARFTFRGPTDYVNLLSQNSVEAVSFANNHTMDYRQAGYDSTLETLKGAGLPYVEKDSTMLMTTQSGLTVGFYAVAFELDQPAMEKAVADLRAQGAEVVVVSAHWGTEGSYRPKQAQTKFAHAAIDAGADIVYGHHPHVLQPIEEYNGGVIFYSLGNFSFGGNNYPRDLDTAILQQEIVRDVDGSICLGELTVIPASISSLPKQNDFKPTPYEPDSDKYNRVLAKLDGSFKGADLVPTYK